MTNRTYQKTYAGVSFLDEGLDPLDVTKRLRLPPDDVHRRGEPRLRRSRDGSVVEPYDPWPHGFWSMSSENWVDSPRIETHVAWILQQLEPRADDVARLAQHVEQARIFCFSLGRTNEPPTYPNALDARARALGLHIDIDHYHSRQ